ncbi:MAG: hypothetical protein JWO42_4201, partial [Chloroflexi bacterium]|nr:hypothetical protein [Chloroflexota bacterium]
MDIVRRPARSRLDASPYLICNDGALAVAETMKLSHMPAWMCPGT